MTLPIYISIYMYVHIHIYISLESPTNQESAQVSTIVDKDEGSISREKMKMNTFL